MKSFKRNAATLMLLSFIFSTVSPALAEDIVVNPGETAIYEHKEITGSFTNKGTATVENVVTTNGWTLSEGSVTNTNSLTNVHEVGKTPAVGTVNGEVYASSGTLDMRGVDLRLKGEPQLHGGTVANPTTLDTLKATRVLFGDIYDGGNHQTIKNIILENNTSAYTAALGVYYDTLTVDNISVDAPEGWYWNQQYQDYNYQMYTGYGGVLNVNNSMTSGEIMVASSSLGNTGTLNLADGAVVNCLDFQNTGNVTEETLAAGSVHVNGARATLNAAAINNHAITTLGTVNLTAHPVMASSVPNANYGTGAVLTVGELNFKNLEGDTTKAQMRVGDNAKTIIGGLTSSEVGTNFYVTGTSDTSINKDGGNKVQYTGNIVFTKYNNATTDGTKVSMNLDSSDDYFTGAVRGTTSASARWGKWGPAENGDEVAANENVQNMTLNLSNGAKWNVTGDSFVNNLTVDNASILGDAAKTVTVTTNGTFTNASVETNIANKGTLTVTDNASVVGGTFTNKGVLNMKNDVVGTALAVDKFVGEEGGSIDFDADISGTKQDTDHITVTTKASGNVALGNVNIKSDTDSGDTKVLSLFEKANDDTDFSGLNITGTATTVTSTGKKYDFVQDTTSDNTKGNIVADVATTTITLPDIVQNKTVDDYKAGQIETYSLTDDYTATEDLGTLTSVNKAPGTGTDATNTRKLTIYGNNHNLSGDDKKGVTVQQGGTLTLNDVASFGGFDGDAITANQGTVNINNTTVNGDIKVDGVAGNATLTNSTLNGTTTVNSGKLHISGDAPTVDEGGNKIYKSRVNGEIKGSVSYPSDVDITNTLLTNKVAYYGGVWEFSNSRFEGSEHGAITSDSTNVNNKLILNNVEFVNNSGARTVNINNGIAEINGSTLFKGNSNGVETTSYGGTLTASGTSNTNRAQLTVDGKGKNVSFIENINEGGYGAAVTIRSNTDFNVHDVNELTVSGNRSASGGAMYIGNTSAGAEPTVNISAKTVKFENNIAASNGGAGGAIHVNQAPIKIEADTLLFTGNKYTGTADESNKRAGGALFVRETKARENVIGKDSGITTFSDNTSNDLGGAIGVYKSGTDQVSLTVKGTTIFDGNTAAGNGGAVWVRTDNANGSLVNFTGDTTFTNNTSEKSGGAIYNKGYAKIVLGKSSNFTGNEAAEEGGAIYNEANGEITLDKANFSGNTADGKANDIYNAGTVNIVSDTSFGSGVLNMGTFNFMGAGNVSTNYTGTGTTNIKAGAALTNVGEMTQSQVNVEATGTLSTGVVEGGLANEGIVNFTSGTLTDEKLNSYTGEGTFNLKDDAIHSTVSGTVFTTGLTELGTKDVNTYIEENSHGTGGLNDSNKLKYLGGNIWLNDEHYTLDYAKLAKKTLTEAGAVANLAMKGTLVTKVEDDGSQTVLVDALDNNTGDAKIIHDKAMTILTLNGDLLVGSNEVTKKDETVEALLNGTDLTVRDATSSSIDADKIELASIAGGMIVTNGKGVTVGGKSATSEKAGEAITVTDKPLPEIDVDVKIGLDQATFEAVNATLAEGQKLANKTGTLNIGSEADKKYELAGKLTVNEGSTATMAGQTTITKTLTLNGAENEPSTLEVKNGETTVKGEVKATDAKIVLDTNSNLSFEDEFTFTGGTNTITGGGKVKGDKIVNNATLTTNASSLNVREIENNSAHTLEFNDSANAVIDYDITMASGTGDGHTVINTTGSNAVNVTLTNKGTMTQKLVTVKKGKLVNDATGSIKADEMVIEDNGNVTSNADNLRVDDIDNHGIVNFAGGTSTSTITGIGETKIADDTINLGSISQGQLTVNPNKKLSTATTVLADSMKLQGTLRGDTNVGTLTIAGNGAKINGNVVATTTNFEDANQFTVTGAFAGGNYAALGNNITIKKVAKGSVALGNGSVADAENTVSVGNSTTQRKIVNVKAGDITSATSTDAVNGGQLYATNRFVEGNAANITALQNTVGNATGGLVKDVSELQTTIGTKANVSDLANYLTTEAYNTDKAAFESAIGSKANASDLIGHTGDSVSHVTATERTKWNGYETAINGIDVRVAANTHSISDIQTDLAAKAAVADVTALSVTVAGHTTAITEHAGKIAELETTVGNTSLGLVKAVADIKADAVKTVSYDASTGKLTQTTISGTTTEIGTITAGGGEDTNAVHYSADKSKIELLGSGGTTISNVKAVEITENGSYAATTGQLFAEQEARKTAVADATLKEVTLGSDNKTLTIAENGTSKSVDLSVLETTQGAKNTANIAANTAEIAAVKNSVKKVEKAYVGAEYAGNKLTFTKADGSTDSVTIESGGGSGAIAGGKIPDGGNVAKANENGTAVASGYNSEANAENSVANGFASAVSAKSTAGIAIGKGATVGYKDGIISGEDTAALSGIAIGENSRVEGANSVAVGYNNAVTGEMSTSVGYMNEVSGNRSGAFGDPNIIDASYSYAVGNNNNILTTGITDNKDGSFVLGNENTVTGKGTFVLGNNVTKTANNSVILGNGSEATEENTVSVGSAANQRRIVSVADGINPTDAVNMRQLYARDAAISANAQEIREVGAISAALAGLHFAEPSGEEGDKLVGAVAYGGYRGANAEAIGVAYKPNPNMMLSASTSISNGNDSQNAYNVGFSLKFGKGETAQTRAALQKQVKYLNGKIETLERDNEAIRKENAEIKEMLKKLIK